MKMTHKLSLSSGDPRTAVPVCSLVHKCAVPATRAHHFSQQWHQHLSVQ